MYLLKIGMDCVKGKKVVAGLSVCHFYLFSKEMCDKNANFTMCPKCDLRCNYWDLSTACYHVRVSHIFDNDATVFFAIFMSLWGKLKQLLKPLI